MGNRINTIMQPCFFALANVLPPDEAVARIKESVQKTYGKRGPGSSSRGTSQPSTARCRLTEVTVPPSVTCEGPSGASGPTTRPTSGGASPSRCWPVRATCCPSALFPADGSFMTGTTKYEKRAIAREIPLRDPELCIDCGKCSLVCPHAVIRMRCTSRRGSRVRPRASPPRTSALKELPGHKLTIQVSPDDCTGCAVCVNVCPALETRRRSSARPSMMASAAQYREPQRPELAVLRLDTAARKGPASSRTVKGSQVLEPLFEFSGACAGCGETPYVKLVSQAVRRPYR